MQVEARRSWKMRGSVRVHVLLEYKMDVYNINCINWDLNGGKIGLVELIRIFKTYKYDYMNREDNVTTTESD